jgi:hypothetical protein
LNDGEIELLEKNMVYHKSVAEVRRRSQDLVDKMKPDNFDHVESKIQHHFKQRHPDLTPESLKPKNLRYLDKKEEVPKPKENPKEKMQQALLSPIR